MRWLITLRPSKPLLGDEQMIIKFAWLPVKCCRNWVWLERFRSFEKYKSITSLGPDTPPIQVSMWVQEKALELN